MEVKIECYRNLEALRQNVPFVARQFELLLSLILDRALLRNYDTDIITDLFNALIFAAEGGEEKQVPGVGLIGQYCGNSRSLAFLICLLPDLASNLVQA